MAAQEINLPDFFVGAAKGVTAAQRRLEARRVERRRLDYTIPGARLAAGMSFRHDAEHGSIFTGVRHTSEETGFQLKFALLATPHVPSAPPSIDASNLQSVVAVPWFLVRDPERDELAEILVQRLRSLNGVTVDIPGEPANPRPNQFKKEAKEIEKVLENDDSEEPDDSIGVVAVALDDARTSFLIVRLGKHPEGIFILRKTPDVGVTVYRHRDAEDKKFYYKPLRLIISALREWMVLGQPGISQAVEPLPAMLGPVPTREVARAFWKGQAAARQALHDLAAATRGPSAQMRVFYQLSDVHAVLSFTVPADAAMTDVDLVRSEVNVVPRDPDIAAGLPARADLTLRSPDYTVTGDARETLLDLIQAEDAEEVLDRLEDDLPDEIKKVYDRETYEGRLKDPDGRRLAVVVLSYRFETPVNEFLVVWPAMLEEQQREFAFRVKVARGKITKAEFFLPVEDPNPEGRLLPPPRLLNMVTISEDGYVGFHDFLHAIRIWNLKSRPPKEEHE